MPGAAETRRHSRRGPSGQRHRDGHVSRPRNDRLLQKAALELEGV